MHARAKALARGRKLKKSKNSNKENNRENTLVVHGTRRPVRFNANAKDSGGSVLTEAEEQVEAAAAKERVEKERDLRAAQEHLALFQWYNKLTKKVVRAWAMESRRSAALRKLEADKARRADVAWAKRAKPRFLHAWKEGSAAASKRRRYAEALAE